MRPGGELVATLGRGEGVGEIALLHDVPRTATVIACRRSLLFALAKQPFLLALTNHPQADSAARTVAGQRLSELADAGGRERT